MAEKKQRMQSITPYHVSQGPSTEKDKKPDKVRVLSDTSTAHFSPGHDPLMQSLSSGIPELPNRYHLGKTNPKIKSKGVNYEPRGEFGHIKDKTAKGTHYLPHTSKPGQNALGQAMNRVGQKSGYPQGGKRA